MSRLEKNNTESDNKTIRSYESTREKISKVSKVNRKQITRSVPIDQTEISEDEDLNLLASIHISGNSTSGLTEIHQECSHDQTINENGIDICIECGNALYDKLTHEAEWRYYGENDNQHSFDPSRVQYRKTIDKGIKKDLEKLDLPQQVVELSDKLYNKVTNGDIKRSNLRKGIIFACVLYAYNQLGNPKTSLELQKMFDGDNDEEYVKRKNISKGIIYFKKRMPKEETKNQYITAEHYIPQVLEKFNIKSEHATNILELYKNLKEKSSIINRRNPQSVSCGIVFYYLKRLNLDISASKFGKLVNLSEITINNITSEIEDIIYS